MKELYLTIDIGGTFIKYALMDESTEIFKRGKFNSPKDSLDEFKEEMTSLIDENLSQDLKGIAISCPGTVDVRKGVIYHGGILTYLHEVNMVEWLNQKYNLPVSIENDGKAAALAELWMGSAIGCRNVIVLVLGTGVGCGIIIDGKLYRGSSYSAGEVSFIMTNYDVSKKEGEFFGFKGSAVGMLQEISKLNHLDSDTDGRTLFEYIKPSNEKSWGLFINFCKSIALQILNLQYILNPEKIVIGGGVSAQPIVIEHLHLAINELLSEEKIHNAIPNVEAAHFQNDANLVGALYHHLEHMKSDYNSWRNNK